METKPITLRLDQLPLWRLLVALDDAERVAGSDSPTARALAREVNRRLKSQSHDSDPSASSKGGAR